MLFAPGNHARRVASALASAADVVVLDLEDAVPAAEKVAARAMVAAASRGRGALRLYVRVNVPGGVEFERDLEAITGCTIDGIVVPKAEAAPALVDIDARLSVVEGRMGLPAGAFDLMPIVETAAGVSNCEAIASASPRVRRLIFGGADYTLDLDL